MNKDEIQTNLIPEQPNKSSPSFINTLIAFLIKNTSDPNPQVENQC